MFAPTKNTTASFRNRSGTPAASSGESRRASQRPYRRPEIVTLGGIDRMKYGYTGLSDGGSEGYTHYA
jgi:hypothetical protein